MATQEPDKYCPRHPSTQTNLRCGRCGELICPRCMITSPVGARCPDCARIGRPKILDADASDLSRAALAAGVVGVTIGVLGALVAWILWQLSPPLIVSLLLIAVMFIGAGVPIGEAIRRAGNRSMDTRIRYLAALSVFVVYVVTIFLSAAIGVAPGIFTQLIVLIGLGMGMWTAMNRIRR